MSDFTRVGPDEAHRVLEDEGVGQLVDVRENSEVSAVRVDGALNLPLSRLKSLAGRIDRRRPVFLLCRSGARAAQAASQLRALGVEDVRVVEGGLDAWTAAGKPVVRATSRVWSMERQVRFTAGSLVAAGTAAGLLFDPRFFVLPAFVGAGLVFSAVTDTCTMALVLGRLPWNRDDSCGP